MGLVGVGAFGEAPAAVMAACGGAPARGLTGGVGEVGEKLEGDECNLWTCSVWVGMTGKGIPNGE